MNTQQAAADLFPIVAKPDSSSYPPSGYYYLYPKTDGFYAMDASGNEYQVSMQATGHGTSFPSTPKLGDEFLRDDLDHWYKYGVSEWIGI